MEYHAQLKKSLRNKETMREIKNHPSIHTTLIIIILNVRVRNRYVLQMWIVVSLKTCAYISTKIDKISDNSIDQSESQKIYVYIAHMSCNAEIPRRYFGDRSQLTNLVLDSGVTCHMTQDISDFIPCSLVEMDKYIEVSDGNFVTAKQTE